VAAVDSGRVCCWASYWAAGEAADTAGAVGSVDSIRAGPVEASEVLGAATPAAAARRAIGKGHEPLK
jgi:hypothetical protein